MRTTDLIDQLALETRPVRAGSGRQLGIAALLGGAATLAAVLLAYGVQPGITATLAAQAFAMKAAYAGSIGATAAAGVAALAQPGVQAPSWRWLLLPVTVLALLAIATFSYAAPDAWPSLLLGGSWSRCPLRIAVLSLPILAVLTVAMRRQAPTDLRRAGAATGLAAGAGAAVLYALACTESSPAFVLVWYSAGIALSTALGALAGPRLLRW